MCRIHVAVSPVYMYISSLPLDTLQLDDACLLILMLIFHLVPSLLLYACHYCDLLHCSVCSCLPLAYSYLCAPLHL